MSENVLDFSNVESVESNLESYLAPGYYHVKPTAVELVEETKADKNSYLKVEFTAVNEPYEGQVLQTKFYLTAKALPRLQYLHENYFGQKLENKAITYKQLAEYFSKKMVAKPKTIFLSVSGREGVDKNGVLRVYADLPYGEFIINEVDNPNVEEGAFEEGSAAYNKAIRKQKNAATSSSAAVLSNGGGAKTEEWIAPWELEEAEKA